MKTPRITPIILAAGDHSHLGYPKPLAQFGGRTALEIAVGNCLRSGLGRPIVVFGYRARRILPHAPKRARVAVNRAWRRGQLSSLLAALRLVPRGRAFLIYPVDQPLLTSSLIRRLARAYATRKTGQHIIMPRCGGRAGHPVICSGAIRAEFSGAKTAREVIYRDVRRIRYVSVRDKSIWLDFDSPASYRKCVGLAEKRRISEASGRA